MSDLDLVELNEAFAAQALPVMRELGLDQEKVNVNGYRRSVIQIALGLAGRRRSRTRCGAGAHGTGSRPCASVSARA